MSDANRIADRQKLDRVLGEAARDVSPVTRAQAEAFEAMLRGRRRPASRGASLRDEIDQLTMPEIADATIFRAGRSRALLQHVLDEILPRLGAEDDVAAIAEALLSEEIARQDDIADRLATDGAP